MAGRLGMRQVARRFFSSGGKVLSEEEKAAENVYIKKMEREKLEKLARKGPKEAGEANAASQTAATGEANAASQTAATGEAKAHAESSSSEKISRDKNRNYAVVAGTVAFASALGWYLLSKPAKSKDEVSD
ncbi:hypothetical protein LUZ60_016043 [Juncus effusus]|nr:hypothetical protein LUZ60_016043 [Juncus effusus]